MHNNSRRDAANDHQSVNSWPCHMSKTTAVYTSSNVVAHRYVDYPAAGLIRVPTYSESSHNQENEAWEERQRSMPFDSKHANLGCNCAGRFVWYKVMYRVLQYPVPL
jgi:hypothetical protein